MVFTVGSLDEVPCEFPFVAFPLRDDLLEVLFVEDGIAFLSDLLFWGQGWSVVQSLSKKNRLKFLGLNRSGVMPV